MAMDFGEELEKAVRDLTRFKQDRHPDADPAAFARAILPFMDCGVGELTLERSIDPTLVLSANYQKHPDPGEAAAADCIGSLNEETIGADRGSSLGGNAARYLKVQGLPLYIAQEGKNRVALARRHGLALAAWVVECSHPAPSELLLMRQLPWKGWALERPISGESIVLPFPAEAVRFYGGLGVRQGRRRLGLLAPLKQLAAEGEATHRMNH